MDGTDPRGPRPGTRRFDAVVIYQTSRLSRDRVSAGLFHRELRKVGVEIHYAIGAGDPSTAEGGLMIALQQAFDEYERASSRARPSAA